MAKAGDTVTLTFETSESINQPMVTFKSGGIEVSNPSNPTSDDNVNWSASYIVDQSDTDGNVSYQLELSDLAGNNYDTNEVGTDIVVDTTTPTLSNIQIVSSNTNQASTTIGDTITLSFEASEQINTPAVTFKSGNNIVAETPTITNNP